MSLIKGKSEKAFKQNVRTEMHEGKPQKQSLAIAYAMKRKHKKLADGGPVLPGAASAQQSMRDAFNPRKRFADGGSVYGTKGVHEDVPMYNREKNRVEKGKSQAGHLINQHGEEEQGPDSVMMADGGFITDNYQSPEHEMDMVGRIMKQRQMHYSEGGRVANETPIVAGFEPNEFDDLVLRDDLESSYGEDDNSGDALGNKGEDERRKDIVARIMASRRKKDRLPSPA